MINFTKVLHSSNSRNYPDFKVPSFLSPEFIISRCMRSHSKSNSNSKISTIFDSDPRQRIQVNTALENKIGILDMNKIRGAYVLYSNDQYILLRESIGNMLRSLGVVISNFELNRLLEAMKTPKLITIEDFCQIYLRCKSKKGDLNELQEAVASITNGKSQVNIAQLKQDLCTLGDILSEQEFNQVLDIVGHRDGFVNCRQLISILMFV